MKKVVFTVIVFCILGHCLFAQTEYEAVIFDRSVLMGDSVRNVRRDVPYLSPGKYIHSNVIDGMQRLDYFESSTQIYPSRDTSITADFFLNRLYNVRIFISNVNRQRIQNDITALRSIYGKESINFEDKQYKGTTYERRYGRIIWQAEITGNENPIFTVILDYSEFGFDGGVYQYTLTYVYFPVFYELSYALVSAGKKALTPP